MRKIILGLGVAGIMLLIVPTTASAFESHGQPHRWTDTEQHALDDNRNGTPNEAGDEMPLFYFDETTQECVDTTGTDTDADGVFDGCDNCLYVANPDQEYDEELGTGGVACNGDIAFQPAPVAEPPPAAPDENPPTGGDTSTTRGAFLADDGGSCALMPSSKMPTTYSIFWIVGMTVGILAIRRRSVA